VKVYVFTDKHSARRLRIRRGAAVGLAITTLLATGCGSSANRQHRRSAEVNRAGAAALLHEDLAALISCYARHGVVLQRAKLARGRLPLSARYANRTTLQRAEAACGSGYTPNVVRGWPVARHREP
jgi:hypothetical protein